VKRVAVIGARGFIGSALVEAFSAHPDFDVTAVTRENYADAQQNTYDVLVNCAMPSARFRAKQDPAWDFRETVQKTADLFHGWNFQKFVQLSSVSARCQLDTAYGRHKAAAEAICNFGDHLIVRSGAVYDADMKKGVLVDMMQGKTVFVDGESRYCFASRDFLTNWIVNHLDRTGIVEVGGRNAIALKEVAAHLNAQIGFEGVLDHQEVSDSDPDYPEAREVLAFLDNWKPQP
jgi:nucleoside-diphosphate-sugar epimerase